MFGWPKVKKPVYPKGTIVKFRRGKNNDLTDRYVLGIVMYSETKQREWGDLLGVQIHGSTRIHHIWTNKTVFMEVSDGERMLLQLENS